MDQFEYFYTPDLFDGIKKLNVVSVSGGKDSTATALLAIKQKVENLIFVFADTGNEAQITYDYIEYLDKKFRKLCGTGITKLKADFRERLESRNLEEDIDGFPIAAKYTGIPILDLAQLYGKFPTARMRFCTGELKRDVIRQFFAKWLKSGYVVIDWQGIRSEESPARAKLLKYSLTDTYANGGTLWRYLPILNWKAQDCFDMLRRNHVKPNPLYAKGFSRVGCFPCINWKKEEIALMAKKFPERINEIREWEKIVSGCRADGNATFFLRGNIDETIKWARNKK